MNQNNVILLIIPFICSIPTLFLTIRGLARKFRIV
jgi:hypothetical protein